MKTILTLLFALTFIQLQAQSSGDYLEKAGNQFQAGFWLTLGGAGMTTLSYLPTEQDFQTRLMRGAGAASTLTGVALTYAAFVNIKKAGKASSRKSTGFHPTPSGIAYRF